MLSGAPLQQLFSAYENRQPVRSLTSTGEGQYDYYTPFNAVSNGYQIEAFGPNKDMYRVYQNLPQGADQLDFNDKPFDVYDKNKQYVGTHKFQNMGGGPVLNFLDKAWDTAIPVLTSMFIGGGLAAGAGAGGPMAQSGGFFNPGTATTGAGGVGAGAGGGLLDLGGGISMGADGAIMGATPMMPGGISGLSNAGIMNMIGAGGGGSSGLSGILQQLGITGNGGTPNLGSLLKTGLGQILGGGGGGGSSGSGLFGTGVGLNDIIGLIGGGVDASRQGAAADAMRQWLQQNQAKMEGYMQPNSPEWNQMWEAMSRKDAAAGRNSQYGPRTADFLAQVAQAKASNILNFTTGNSRALSNALNQDASKYAGLSSALGRAFGGSVPTNLSSILNNIGGGANFSFNGSTGGQDLGDVWSGVDAWDEAWSRVINGGEDFIDFGEFI